MQKVSLAADDQGLRTWIYFARFGAPHGIAGTIYAIGEDSQTWRYVSPKIIKIVCADGVKQTPLWKYFADLSHFEFAALMNAAQTCEVKKWIIVPHTLKSRISLVGIDCRDAAKLLTGCSVFVSRSALSQDVSQIKGFHEESVNSLPVFWSDLYHRFVYVQEKKFGQVVDIYNFGASDVLRIKGVDNMHYEIPYIYDYFPCALDKNLGLQCMCTLEDILEYYIVSS